MNTRRDFFKQTGILTAAGITVLAGAVIPKTQAATNPMTPLYGSIIGYSNALGVLAIFLGFPLTPGVTYEQQLSFDGGNTWQTVGTVTMPASLPVSASVWNTALMVPGGVPTRLVPT